MQYASSLLEKGRSFLWILLLGIGAGAYASDSYNGVDLTIPTAIVGGAHFSNMVVTPATILGAAQGTPNGTEDSYDPASNELSIPSVLVGANTYTNATITVGSLVSIGSVSGADTYNGTYILSPVLQVLGGPVYNTLMFKFGSIVSLGGGMPRNVRDVYDPSTHEVTIAAIQVGSTVYTNAVVTLGNAYYANGTGIPVPNVVGHTQANAELEIRAVGMTVGTLSAQLSGTVAAGNVISQSPTTSNFGYPSGTAVDLVVSIGATGTPVPNVVGDTQAAATTALNAAGLTVGTVGTAASNTVAAGDVISENPAAGTHVAPGSPVNLVISTGAAQGAASLVYSFAAPSGNTTGYYPGVLLQAPAPDRGLYGVNQVGGTHNNGNVFRINLSNGTESVVFTFPAPTTSGQYIPNGLIFTPTDGNLYGTTQGGGTYGGGTLYKLTPQGVQTPLYNFCGCLDNLDYFEGESPGGLLLGADGNFWGVDQGGSSSSGTVFVIPHNGLGKVEYTFTDQSGDGANPTGALILAKDGAYWGVTDHGGKNGTGTVFKISSTGAESVVYSFGAASGHDGQQPVAGLVQASNGNFYGMTFYGGTNNTGAVFRITPAGVETVLYSFPPPVNSQPAIPTGPMIQATDGNLYGATTYGGIYNFGMIFKITPSGTFSIVHSFGTIANDGAFPAAIIQGADGNLYGTARAGGANLGGAVFKITL